MTKKAGLADVDISSITKKWQELQKKPGIFAYKLNIRNKKHLSGNYHFYAEHNPERSMHRRPPQTITSLNPRYNDERFNFNKIDPRELIVSVPFNDEEVAFIINKSPLTKYHTLICPDLEGRHGQRVTLDSLRFCTAFLRQLKNKAYRIGYNSPGALASVNHLHFHLIYLDVDLYIDHAKLELLAKKHIFRFTKDMPTQGLCWFICKNDNDLDMDNKLREIYDFLMWLCCKDRPHNIFMQQVRNSEGMDGIQIFVFAREDFCVIKNLQNLNIGFCEYAGFVPLGNMDVYRKLTEDVVLAKIRCETGDVYNEVYSYFENMKRD